MSRRDSVPSRASAASVSCARARPAGVRRALDPHAAGRRTAARAAFPSWPKRLPMDETLAVDESDARVPSMEAVVRLCGHQQPGRSVVDRLAAHRVGPPGR